jgi:hypothetical protein
MYGLPQACILANKLLAQCLGQHGYFKVQHTPSLWKHASHPICFNLCIDNFGVKYIGNENLKHLFAALRTEMYEIVEAEDLGCTLLFVLLLRLDLDCNSNLRIMHNMAYY